MGEPKLTYAPLPERRWNRRPEGVEYKYEKYVSLIDQFLESNEPFARVDSDEKGLDGHVRYAIFHSSGRDKVEVCMRNGKVWLRRKT